jgi:hypothetical protein
MLACIISVQTNRLRFATAIAVALIAALPLSACGSTVSASKGEAKETSSMENGRDKAIAAGREFVKLRYPDFVEDRKTPVATDKGDTWEFTYRLPDDMLGGAPVVIFNKVDLSVKESYRTQ